MSLRSAPSGQSLEASFVLAIVLCLLFGGLMIGPIGLCVCGLVFSAMFVYRLPVQTLAPIIGLALAVQILFGYSLDDAYWSDRLHLVWSVFGDPDGFVHWVTNLNITIDALAGGVMMAALARVSYELWWLSPFRRINRKIKMDQVQRQGQPRINSALRSINGQPASLGDATCLGVDKQTGKPVMVPDSSLNTHMLIAGTTGSGKTVTLLNVVESFIDRGLPVIFIDGKGDLALKSQVISYARYRNRKQWGFAMVGPSCKYNPLQGNYTALKDKIIGLRREWSEEHYLKLAEGYLQMVFKVLQSTKETLSLVTASRMLDLEALVLLVRTAVKSGKLSKQDGQELLREVAAQEDAAKHVESLKAELNNLAHSHLQPLFDVDHTTKAQDVLDLASVLSHKGVAYIALNPMQYPQVAGVMGRLILNDLKTSLDPLNPQKVLLVIDEVSTLISPQILNLLNQGRYVGLHIILTVQSLTDLGRTIKNNAALFMRQILANCNVMVIHKINDPDDADTLAALLGTQLNIDYTAQVAEFGFETGLGSARLIHEYLAHPDHIKALNQGEAFLLDKNQLKKLTGFLARKSLLVA